MTRKSKAATLPVAAQQRRTSLVPMAAIRRLARRIAERFQPEKIILFGSYARGEANAESDVDILVVMPARNEVSQAIRIREAVDPVFPLDLIVRTPHNVHWRMQEGDWFLRDAVGRGKLLHSQDSANGSNGCSWRGFELSQQGDGCLRLTRPMQKLTAEWVRKAEMDWQAAGLLRRTKPPLSEAGCFHCQQTVEKYYKALLQELGLAVPRTHDLNRLLSLLLHHDDTLSKPLRALQRLSEQAVDIRYPGTRATVRQFQSSLALAQGIRREVRDRLGLSARPSKRRKRR